MFSLSNKNILITGATGHLGRSISYGLASLGAIIHVNSRSVDDCEALAADIRATGLRAEPAPFNVTVYEEIRGYADATGHLDVLINNAYSGGSGTMLSATCDDFITSYNSSVIACARLTKILEPKLSESAIRNGTASIINIASMYGSVSPDFRIYESLESTNPPFYGAAKAALIQLTKYAACEFASKNIRVNCVSPGPFPSHETLQKLPNMVDRIVSKVPIGRIGCPTEMVGPIAFLASDASSYVTGINLPVDGGWTAW